MNWQKPTKIATHVLMLILLSGCAAMFNGQSSPTSTPKPPIDLLLKDLQGDPVNLRDLRGKVVLVNFWASWCSPCRDEMPLLDAFYLSHKSDNFTVVAVNVSESAKDAAKYVEEHGYSFTVWSDPSGNAMIELGINGLLASLLLDEAGRIQKVWLGPLTQEILEDVVVPMLDK